MISINDFRKKEQGILMVGLHSQIIQSILDFDFVCGKSTPSIVGVIANNRGAAKFFFGTKEILIPCFPRADKMPIEVSEKITFGLIAQSGRRTLESAKVFFKQFPHALGIHLFAENVPELHALELIREYGGNKIIAGPSGVGLLVPGFLKLGAIGGTDFAQINASHLSTSGSIAVVGTSGGMTNELIRSVAQKGKRLSFACCIGGDRFPGISLTNVLMLAQEDDATQAIVYFGELGGTDEYEISEMVRNGKLTKPVLAYIAGIIDESFEERQQFGHAKALAQHADESARAKQKALRDVGVNAPETFAAFIEAFATLPQAPYTDPDMTDASGRTPSILSTRKIIDLESVSAPVQNGKLIAPRQYALSHAILSALLNKKVSNETAALMEHIFELLIDHGGEVSGAVNTMITARAGKDLVASLASGILTVGPRFGGAVNEAARQWIEAVAANANAAEFVESRTKGEMGVGPHRKAGPSEGEGGGVAESASRRISVTQTSAAEWVEQKTRGGKLLAGIGHRKYRVGLEDPRVQALSEFASLLQKHPHYDFAREVEKVTTGKNGKLILNVDGVMAALMLDFLVEKDGFSPEELQSLLDTEFFNALFVIPRSVGFIAHFMEQKKNDEGLFRLPENLLFTQE